MVTGQPRPFSIEDLSMICTVHLFNANFIYQNNAKMACFYYQNTIGFIQTEGSKIHLGISDGTPKCPKGPHLTDLVVDYLGTISRYLYVIALNLGLHSRL